MVSSLLEGARAAYRLTISHLAFVLIVVITVAVGIGGTVGAISLLDAIITRPLAVPAHRALALLSLVDTKSNMPTSMVPSEVRTFAETQRPFSGVAGYLGGAQLPLKIGDTLTIGGLECVSGDYYSVLGIRPALGRLISRADAPFAGDSAHVAMIGYKLWQDRFGARRDAIGQVVQVNGVSFRIVGVLPSVFHGFVTDVDADVSIPLGALSAVMGLPSGPVPPRYLVARLKPGVTLQMAQTELDTLWPRIHQSDSESAGGSDRLLVESGATGISTLRRLYRKPVLLLLALTSILALVSCSQTATLLILRLSTLERELMIELALGASLWRLRRRTMCEITVLVLAGGVLSCPLWWLLPIAVGSTLGQSLNGRVSTDFSPDVRVIAFGIALAFSIAMAIGVVVAMVSTRERGAVTAAASFRATSRSPFTRVLLVAQSSVAFILVVGAGLFGMTLWNLRAVDPGFHTRDALVVRAMPQPNGYRNLDAESYYPKLVDSLSGIPNVRSVALAGLFPDLRDTFGATESISPLSAAQGSGVQSVVETISPDFWRTVGISMMRGRDFRWTDDADHENVAIVSEALARRLYGTADPIGVQVRSAGAQRPLRIVGVVSDASLGNMRETHLPVLYRPWLQVPERGRYPNVIVRATRPEGLALAVGRVISGLGHEFPAKVHTLDDDVRTSLAQERILAWLGACLALFSIFLVFVGLYGALALRVQRSRREIGIRIALGARRGDLIKSLVIHSLLIVVVGGVVGAPLALAGAKAVAHLLFGVSPSSLVVLAVAAVVCTAVAIAAAWLPARAACSVEPSEALRSS